jgi:hypothetical protein
MMMKIRNDRPFAQALPEDRDRLASLQESLARCGMACANLLQAWAGGADGAARGDDGAGGQEPSGALRLLNQSAWIGELNLQLAVLTAMQSRILPRLMDRGIDRELAPIGERATYGLWVGGNRWGAALCRLLRRLPDLPKADPSGGGAGRSCLVAAMAALQQLHELLIHALRWRAQWGLLDPRMPDLPRPTALERELAQLERAWLAARFCGLDERRAVLRQIGHLQHWLAGFRDRRVNRHLVVRKQTTHPRPWLNRMVRAGVSG